MKPSLEISVQDFNIVRREMSDWVLIDVREPWEWEKACVTEAQYIPLGYLTTALVDLDPHLSYYTLCHHGVRSLKAAIILRGHGLMAQSIRGGIEAWAREVDRSVERY